MAIFTDGSAMIHRIARMELYLEKLFEDRFVLVAHPSATSSWAKQWNALPTNRPITSKELLGLSFILPEPDASRRQQFDEWMHKFNGQLPEVILETGGWHTILEFAGAGLGVGVVPESFVSSGNRKQKSRLSTRTRDEKEFPTDAVRMISRKAQGFDGPVNSPKPLRLLHILRSATENTPTESRQS